MRHVQELWQQLLFVGYVVQNSLDEDWRHRAWMLFCKGKGRGKGDV